MDTQSIDPIDLPELPEQEEKLTDASFDSNQVIELARQDPDFLSAMAMPEVFEYQWPPVFIAAWAWILAKLALTRDFSKLALGLPRGFGKTTLVKLMILYIVLFTDRKFVLILSNNQTLANNIIADVADMLSEPNIARLS